MNTLLSNGFRALHAKYVKGTRQSVPLLLCAKIKIAKFQIIYFLVLKEMNAYSDHVFWYNGKILDDCSLAFDGYGIYTLQLYYGRPL